MRLLKLALLLEPGCCALDLPDTYERGDCKFNDFLKTCWAFFPLWWTQNSVASCVGLKGAAFDLGSSDLTAFISYAGK